MAIVSSYGALTAVASQSPSAVSTVVTSGPYYDGFRRSYSQIYQTQPAVRTVIDFFARNIAQLGLQVFRRVSDTDRERVTTHPLPRLIKRPNPSTTRYRFVESTVQDIGTYANGYWAKVRARDRLGLVRLPAGEMGVRGGLLPELYEWTPQGASAPLKFQPSEIVHFRMYDPSNPLIGFPPIETLRRILAEEAAASDYRQKMWKNSARAESVIERPKDAPTWSPERRQQFREQWQEFAGAKAGMTPILEDGMTLKPFGFNARDSQYLESMKLSLERVAAAYHVPLPMVGILDHATFSNIREQHKQLYQDCLGPWLVMLEEELELQLLPEFDDVEDVYLEFNIAEKLKGSFEEQATALRNLVGRPIMTANEGRARLNLPRDSDPKSDKLAEVAPGQGRSFSGEAGDGDSKREAFREVLIHFAARQRARIEKDAVDERADAFNHARWTNELAADISAACPAFESVWGEDARRVASIVNSETWALLEDGAAPWPPARINAVIARFCEALHG